jgi:hypothetical protein
MDGTRSGWLVWARLGKAEFPTFTFEVETEAEAIAAVQLMGFCFTRGKWHFRAERVGIIEDVELGAAAKVATGH